MASGLGGVGQFRLWNDDTNDNRRGTPKPMRWFSTKEELNDFLTQKDRDKQLEQEVFADLADGDTSEKKVTSQQWKAATTNRSQTRTDKQGYKVDARRNALASLSAKDTRLQNKYDESTEVVPKKVGATQLPIKGFGTKVDFIGDDDSGKTVSNLVIQENPKTILNAPDTGLYVVQEGAPKTTVQGDNGMLPRSMQPTEAMQRVAFDLNKRVGEVGPELAAETVRLAGGLNLDTAQAYELAVESRSSNRISSASANAQRQSGELGPDPATNALRIALKTGSLETGSESANIQGQNVPASEQKSKDLSNLANFLRREQMNPDKQFQEVAPDAVALVDDQGRVASPGGEAVVGKSRQAKAGLPKRQRTEAYAVPVLMASANKNTYKDKRTGKPTTKYNAPVYFEGRNRKLDPTQVTVRMIDPTEPVGPAIAARLGLLIENEGDVGRLDTSNLSNDMRRKEALGRDERGMIADTVRNQKGLTTQKKIDRSMTIAQALNTLEQENRTPLVTFAAGDPAVKDINALRGYGSQYSAAEINDLLKSYGLSQNTPYVTQTPDGKRIALYPLQELGPDGRYWPASPTTGADGVDYVTYRVGRNNRFTPAYYDAINELFAAQYGMIPIANDANTMRDKTLLPLQSKLLGSSTGKLPRDLDRPLNEVIAALTGGRNIDPGDRSLLLQEQERARLVTEFGEEMQRLRTEANSIKAAASNTPQPGIASTGYNLTNSPINTNRFRR